MDFKKGLHTDNTNLEQPAGTVTKATNWIRDDAGTYITEKGTEIYSALPTDLTVLLCAKILNSQQILFLCNEAETVSEIGVVVNQAYSTIISNRIGATIPAGGRALTTNKLGFKKNYFIDCEARLSSQGERIVYFVDGYNYDRIINLDDIPTDELFDSSTRWNKQFKMPVVTVSTVTDGGSLLSGVRQYILRYLTAEGNYTQTSVPTNIIPIIDDNKVSRNSFDGSKPQTSTNKSIALNLSNLDLNYPYLEIISVSYIGLASTPKVDVIARLDNNVESRIFTHYSEAQIIAPTTLEEVLIVYPNYIKAKHLLQIDNYLIKSNLVAESYDLDFQSVANAITAFYKIKEIEYKENINVGLSTSDSSAFVDFVGQNNAANYVKEQGTDYDYFEDYKGEKQTTHLQSMQREEVYSLCLIPVFLGGSTGFAYHIPGTSLTSAEANTTTKALGTYISSEDYPEGLGYPTGKIRHHKMPTLTQEHIVRKDGAITYIRVLGIELRNIVFPDEIKSKLEGFLIGIESRDSSLKRTVTCQGFGKRPHLIDNSYYINSVLHGRTEIEDLYAAGSSVDPFSPNSVGGINNKLLSFYAPDIIHNNLPELKFTSIKQVCKYTGVRAYDNRGLVNDTTRNPLLSFINMTDRFLLPSDDRVETELENKYLNVPAYLGNNVDLTLPFNEEVKPFRMQGTNGFVLLKGETEIKLFGSTQETYNSDTQQLNGYTIIDETPDINIYNLYNNIPNAYGTLQQAQYRPCGRGAFFSLGLSLVDGSTIPETSCEIFNGDTFITKYGLQVKDKPPKKANDDDGNYDNPASFDCLIYVWFESIGNYNYRHYDISTLTESGIIQGTLPYYPKTRNLLDNDNFTGLFNYTMEKGHSTGYNKQYHKINDIKLFYPKSIFFEEQLEYPDRNIISERLISGQVGDNWSIFLLNNFQDIGRSKGEITNIFVHKNDVYAHTSLTLFKLFVSFTEALATNASEVVLGTGKPFARLPKEVTDLEHGYLGCNNKQAHCTTPFGVIFPDTNKGKIYMLSEGISEISGKGQDTFFMDNLTAVADGHNTGYRGVYDYINKRYLLSKVGSWTYSYKFNLQSWTGDHDYPIRFGYNYGKDLVLFYASNLYRANKGTQGKYYNLPQKAATIEFIGVADKEINFDNLIVIAQILEGTKQKPDKFFTTLKVSNDYQSTGDLSIVLSNRLDAEHLRNIVKASYKNEEYRIPIAPNSVIDPAGDITSLSNINYNKKFRDRMKGMYSRFRLTYTPVNSEDITLILKEYFINSRHLPS